MQPQQFQSQKKSEIDDDQSALEKAINAGNDLASVKQRVRKKPNEINSNSNVNSTNLSTPAVSGNLSNYDTDDQTDKIMDMLLKNATDGEKKNAH